MQRRPERGHRKLQKRQQRRRRELKEKPQQAAVTASGNAKKATLRKAGKVAVKKTNKPKEEIGMDLGT